MYDYLIYEKSTGRITSRISNQPFDHLVDSVDTGIILLVNPFDGDGWNYYVVDEQLVERPVLAISQNTDAVAADGVDVLRVDGAPEDATYSLFGPVHDTWTGDNEITVDVPGHYDLHIDHWPYQTARVSFDAT